MRDQFKGTQYSTARNSSSDSVHVRRAAPQRSQTGNNTSSKNPKTLGKFVTKHTSKVHKDTGFVGKLFSFIGSVFSVFKRGLLLLWSFIKPVVKRIWKLLKPLPWKIIIPIVLGILLLLFAVFHFYLASPSRITSVIESNYESSQTLEEEINKTNVFLERIPPFSTDVQEAESALYNLNQSSQSASVSLPPKLFSTYAFRNDEDTGTQVDTLYDVADSLDVAVLQRTTEQTGQLLNLSKQFFEKDIEQDTQGYINLINDINKQLSDITSSGSEMDVSTLQRIYQQVLNSAEQYELTKDIDNFNRQTNNVSSEIYKVIYQSWYDYASSVQANLSTFRSSTESIIFAQD